MGFIKQFAAEESSGVFGVLGIDWRTLILQIIAFIVLVLILKKWIYPPIAAMLDRHDKRIKDAVQAAKDAETKSQAAEAETAKLLDQARDTASEIVGAAREEASQLLVAAEADADKRADAIVASARQQLDQDIERARKTLRDETANLVAMATEKVTRHKVDAAADAKLIKTVIHEVEKS